MTSIDFSCEMSKLSLYNRNKSCLFVFFCWADERFPIELGRQYNKDGDIEQWWEQNIIDNFKEKAQCVVDQYGTFFVPEANMTVSSFLYLKIKTK